MYTKFDYLTPSMSKNQRGANFKRTFMRNWPTYLVYDTDAQGNPLGTQVEVMSDFTYWKGNNGFGGAIDSDQAKKIDKLLGTSVKKINAGALNHGYKGIDELYYTILPWKTHQDISIAEVETLIHRYAEPSSSKKRRIFSIRDIDMSLYAGKTAVEQVLALRNKLATTNVIDIDYDMKYNDQWLALIDTDQTIYDVKITSNGNGYGSIYGMYQSWVEFSIDYKLKDNYSVTPEIDTRANRQKPVTIKSSDGSGGTTTIDEYQYTLTKQKYQVYSKISDDVLDQDKFVIGRVDDDDGSGGYTLVNMYVRKSYLESLPSSISQAAKINHKKVKFSDEVGKMMGNDYVKTPVKVWKQLLGIVLLIIAVIATILSYGEASPLIPIAEAIAVGATIALGVLAYYEAQYGNPNAASMYGDLLTVVGYVGAYLGLTAIIENLTKEGLKGILTKYATMSPLELT